MELYPSRRFREHRKEMVASVRTGEPYSHEVRMRRRDGAYRLFLNRAVPVRNSAGEIERWIGSSTDIQEQKLAQEILTRSEKLATAARFAASMAHEINNPLASVTNLVYLALSNPDLDPATRSQLELADQELTRITHLTSQTLRFHRQASAPAVTDVGRSWTPCCYSPRRGSRVPVLS